MKHSSYTLLKGAIDSLCYSILLRPVAHRVLPFNALRIAKVPHAVAHVFTSLVIAQYANSPVSAVLSPSFKLFELRECHALCLHGGNTSEMSVVIRKGEPVRVFASSLMPVTRLPVMMMLWMPAWWKCVKRRCHSEGFKGNVEAAET